MRITATIIAGLMVLTPGAIGSLPAQAAVVTADAGPILKPTPTPFPIFMRVGNGHEPFQHLLFLAEYAQSAIKRGRFYRMLGDELDRSARHAEALRAYEAGALWADGPSTSAVITAMRARRYMPQQPDALITEAFIPAAERGGVDAALLLADLATGGKAAAGSAYHWLTIAADKGSNEAWVRLAALAERSGNIREAAADFVHADTKLTRLQRALKQARDHYLGVRSVHSSPLGIAWLKYAADLSVADAGRLAARLYKHASVTAADRPILIAIAEAAGIDPTASGGYSAMLAAATTDEEREKIIALIKTAADAGDFGAAAVYWHALHEGDDADDPLAHYLIAAVHGGNALAVTDAQKLLARLQPDAPGASTLVAALEVAAAAKCVPAMKALGDLFAVGGPVAADQDRSLAFFRQAADAGDVEAQLRVGLYFAGTTDGAADLDVARQYLKAAAVSGSAAAKAYLAALPAA